VRAAAAELHFVPNPMAQSLHQHRTGTVGLLTNDLSGRFAIPIMIGAEDAFGVGQVSAFLCDSRGDALREQHHLRVLLARRVDGLIVVGDNTNPRPSLGEEVNVPTVYAYSPSSDPDDISVVSDNAGAGRIAVEHLLANGRTRIGYIAGDIALIATGQRVDGAKAALGERGLELVGGKALFGNWSEEWGRTGTAALLAADPGLDAILCGNDVIARGAVDALKAAGKEVPREVSVVGHDNTDHYATETRPQLSTIDMNLKELGRLAVQLLFDSIDGERRPGLHVVGTRLIQRGSSAPKY